MKLFKYVATGLLFALASVTATANTITFTMDFEDVPTDARIQQPYNGLKFYSTSWDSAVSGIYGFSTGGYLVGATSGVQAIYNEHGRDMVIETKDGSLFDFHSTNITAAWRHGMSIDVVGWANGVEVYNQTVIVDMDSPALYQFDFLDIDKVTLVSYGGTPDDYWGQTNIGGTGTQFILDDMKVTMLAAVPEPSTYAMMGFGLFALGFMMYTRRKTG